MKIKLVNNAGYRNLENVTFPVTVEAIHHKSTGGFSVKKEELIRVGARGYWPSETYWSVNQQNCVLLSEFHISTDP